MGRKGANGVEMGEKRAMVRDEGDERGWRWEFKNYLSSPTPQRPLASPSLALKPL